LNIEYRTSNSLMRVGKRQAPLPIGWGEGELIPASGRLKTVATFAPCIVAVVMMLVVAGCVTKSKAKADAQAAFLAGQQQAIMRMSQPHQPVVTFIGPVRNPTVLWSQDLTLAKAIVAAGYDAKADPKQIMIVRNGQAIPVDPKKLLEGEDIPLVAGDLVQIGQ
jgi:hypothetical protein